MPDSSPGRSWYVLDKTIVYCVARTRCKWLPYKCEASTRRRSRRCRGDSKPSAGLTLIGESPFAPGQHILFFVICTWEWLHSISTNFSRQWPDSRIVPKMRESGTSRTKSNGRMGSFSCEDDKKNNIIQYEISFLYFCSAFEVVMQQLISLHWIVTSLPNFD